MIDYYNRKHRGLPVMLAGHFVDALSLPARRKYYAEIETPCDGGDAERVHVLHECVESLMELGLERFREIAIENGNTYGLDMYVSLNFAGIEKKHCLAH